MTCPFLDYRDASDDQSFDEARAYCTAVRRFVQPMRADICNDRYDLDHATDCEIYLAHADGANESDGTDGADGPDESGDAGPGDPADAEADDA